MATPGLRLTQAAELCASLKSQAANFIPPDQTITLDRVGTIQVVLALRRPNKVNVDLGAK